jgi:ubiquitin carboxyl-terminal hydrolase 5/13
MRQVLVKGESSSNANQEQNKITKLAIGKPGGIDLARNEKWEAWLSIHCKSCNVNLDYSKNPKLNDLVTSILNTSTAEKKEDINAWELEILPCEHTLTLQQYEGIKIASKMTATCNDCNLSSNLWLCLTCGNLACGRKNYDGTGGNGHAQLHFKNTQHPLVVKTGTITPSGEASLYCYACDNDVKDPDIAVHLHNLGIDVSTQVKTEKTMSELNLDFNLNFTLSKTIEEGKVLVDVYGPGNTGLENIGNSCYMNSIIQILFSMNEFKKSYFEEAVVHLATCQQDAKECFDCQMSKIMYGLHSGEYSAKQTRMITKVEDGVSKPQEEVEEYQKGIKPSTFKQYFNKEHPEFSSSRQQDAFEYFSYLLEKFEAQEKLKGVSSLSNNFEFDLETRLECSNCHIVKYKNQKTCFLYLNVPNWENKRDEQSKCGFDEIVAAFLGEETVNLNCVKCGESTNYIRTQRVKSFPNYLIIVFGRFLYDWVAFKLETKVEMPIDFDIGLFAKDHKKEGELVITEDENCAIEEEVEPEIQQSSLNILIENGVPELAAKHALLNNANNADMAIMWYFENMDNPILTTPIPKIKKSGGSNTKSANEELIELVISVAGCSRNQASGALAKFNNDTEKAITHILLNPYETFDVKENQKKDSIEFNKNNSPNYNMYGFITHLGKNTSHGHYVAHINKNNDWIYYNDSRVCLSNDPPINKGYIFIYKNKK